MGAQIVDVSEAQEVNVSRVRVQAIHVLEDQGVDVAGAQAADEVRIVEVRTYHRLFIDRYR